MARVLFSFIFYFSCFSVFAQKNQDVIYLKDGSVYRGVLLLSQDTTKVKIEIIGGNIFVVDTKDILSQTKEPATTIRLKGPVTTQPNGWYNELSLGIPFGVDQWGWPTAGITLNYFLGYQYNSYLKTGIGTGLDYYGYEKTMLPLYLRITGDLTKKNTTPFYIADLGYASNISLGSSTEEHKGGLLFFLGGGIKFNTRRKLSINLSAGYKTQFASSHYFHTWLEEPYWEYRQVNRIETRIAFGF